MIPAPIPTDAERRLPPLREMPILDASARRACRPGREFASDDFAMPVVPVSRVSHDPQAVTG
jgi:hypothetical protein